MSREGLQVDLSVALDNKIVGLFFSASWCPPCRRFLPLLVEFYEKLREREAPLEIVFISSDVSSADMSEYMRHHGNWLSLAHSDVYARQLKQRYSVWTIPKLIVVAPDGEIVTTRGRAEVTEMGIDCFDDWVTSCARLCNENDVDDVDGQDDDPERGKHSATFVAVDGTRSDSQENDILYTQT